MNLFTPENGFIRLTRQYVGGIFGGFGLCLIVMKFAIRAEGVSFVESPLFQISGFVGIGLGAWLAVSEQRRIASEQKKTPPFKP